MNNVTKIVEKKVQPIFEENKEEFKKYSETPPTLPLGILEIIRRRVRVVENYRDRINLIMKSAINLGEVKEVMF